MCRVAQPFIADYVAHASDVVVGRVEDYAIVRDQAFRDRQLAASHLPETLLALYRDETRTLGCDHAVLTIRVDEWLLGDLPDGFSARWDNSTFALPTSLSREPLLIAVQRRPLGSDTLSEESRMPIILQRHCAPAFLLPAASENADKVRDLVKPRRT